MRTTYIELTTTLDPELYKEFELLAEELGISKRELARRFIKEYIKKTKEALAFGTDWSEKPPWEER